jgi:hypothetical protein
MSDGFIFGTGSVILTPTYDADGAIVAVPTPLMLPSCIDFNINGKFDVKVHEGQNQYSLAAASGKRTMEVSFTNNIHNARALNLGDAEGITSGQKKVYSDATAFAIPATPFTDTVVPPATGVFVSDGGIFFGATGGADAGSQLTRVASAPAAGQYTVTSLGVYVYAAADVGKPVFRNYVYSITTGKSVVVRNRTVGATAEYSAIITSGTYLGVSITYEFPRCVIKDQSMGVKNGDFTSVKYDLAVLVNPLDKTVFTRYFNS